MLRCRVWGAYNDSVIHESREQSKIAPISSSHSIRPSLQTEADVCLDKLKSLLVANGIASTVLDNCKLVAFQYLFSVGCYNYTTINQPISDSDIATLESACKPGADCTQCQPTYLSVGRRLANTSSKVVENLCEIMMSNQYLSKFDNLGDITDRLNCFFRFPPPLELAFYVRDNSITTGAIVGIVLGSVFFLAVVGLVLFLLWRRRRSAYDGPDTSMGHASFSQSLNMAQSLGMAQLALFSYSDLRKATKGFDDSRLLGKGGSGKVYLGELKGKPVAIKEIARGTTKKGSQVRGWKGVPLDNSSFCWRSGECFLINEFSGTIHFGFVPEKYGLCVCPSASRDAAQACICKLSSKVVAACAVAACNVESVSIFFC
jgi:hypothetical protein